MFEHIRQHFGGEARPVLEELRPEDANKVHLSWSSHFNTASLREHLRELPGLSLRVRGTSDYIIGDNWRRHAAIGQLTEINSRQHRILLVEGLVAEFAKRGYRAVVLSNDEQLSNGQFYEQVGFGELERIIYYEKPDVKVVDTQTKLAITMLPYEHKLPMIEDLLKVDHGAFPWLWWNSQEEFDYYREQEGVTLYIGYALLAGDIQPIGYFGFTLYDRWTHLDRLAIIPQAQGYKAGAYLLAYALRLMADQGAKRVTLSTQINNYQSQRLYEGFGFERVKSLEYNLIGKLLQNRS